MIPGWLAIAATHIAGYEGVRTIVNKIGEAGGEQFKKLLDESHRRDVGHALRLQGLHSPASADMLTARLKHAEKTGEPVPENDIIKAIGRLLPRDKEDGKVDDGGAVEVLDQIAEMPDESFAALMSAMQHNVIAQKAELFVQRYGVRTFTTTFNFLDAAADEFATALQPHADRLRSEAELKGWESWVDY